MSGRPNLLSIGVCTAAVSLMVSGYAAGDASGVGTFLGVSPADARIDFDGDFWTTPAFERSDALRGVVHLPKPVARDGTTVTMRVSDSMGRLLIETTEAAPGGVQPMTKVPFELVVPRVLAQCHALSVAVKTADGQVLAASADFILRPPVEWDDYLCTIWHRHNAKRLPYLQAMYLSGSQWSGNSSSPPMQFIERNYRYYVEAGVDWAVSAYHVWMPDRPKTYYFNLVREAFMADRTDFRVLERNPCMSNHVIRGQLRWKFVHEARMHRDFRPLYYTVADEPGLGNQAAPFDFCYSPHCKAGFREWLQARYPSLEALNAQWDSSYASWDDVRGATTDEMVARTDDNFSAWCDHKDFMDDVLIGAYAYAGEAVKSHDPVARFGIGGAQGPAAVGGWDFWKLCQAFDVIEAYYIGNNYELMRSFKPELIPFHCSFGGTDAERHLIWYLFTHGDGGLLIWDDDSSYVNDEGQYSDRAKAFTPLYKELTGGVGKLRIASKRTDDPIALMHSQANLRVHWALEAKPLGKDWIKRNSSSERVQSRYFRLRESWVKLIEDNALQYRFFAPAQIDDGQLQPYDADTGQGFKVLVLPEVFALSDANVTAVRAFVEGGGTVIADAMPATFDAHGKRRASSPLADLFESGAGGRAILLGRDMLPYYEQRLMPGSGEKELKDVVGGRLRGVLGADRVTPLVVGQDGQCVTGVETTVWRNGQAEMISIHRNPQLRVHELGPQEYKSNAKFETPVQLTVRRAAPTYWYNVRTGEPLGPRDEVSLTLAPFEPTVLMALPAAAKPFDVAVGEAAITITPAQPCALAKPTYHLDFVGPDSKERLVYRTNVVVGPEGGQVDLPVALNDMPGQWTLRVREVATGLARDVPFTVGG